MSFNGFNTNTQIPVPFKGMSLTQNDPSYANFLQNVVINSPNQISVRYGAVLKYKFINPPQLGNIIFSKTLMISYFITPAGISETIVYQNYYTEIAYLNRINIILVGNDNITNFNISIQALTQQEKIILKNNFYNNLKVYIRNNDENIKPTFYTEIQNLIVGDNSIEFDIPNAIDNIDEINGFLLFYERAFIGKVPDDGIEVTPIVLQGNLDAGVIVGSVNYQNSLIIFNGVDPCYVYDGELYEFKSDVPVPLSGAVNKASATVVSFTFVNNFAAELQKYLKVNEKVTLASGGNYIKAIFTITAVAFNGNTCTLTINATADNPIPIEVKTVLYKKSLPHFSEICVINDRLWALPEGRSGLAFFRTGNKQMLVYYADKAKSLEWYTASGILPFIQMSANSDANDNIETIRAWEGRVLFMGKKRIQVWNNADPTEHDDARNINIAEFAWQKTENIGLFHKRSIVEMPGILLFLSDTGIGTITIDGFNNLIFNSEISREIWDKTKDQINSIKTESEYRDIRGFKYNFGGFFGFKIGYICYIYQANGIYAWGTFSGAFTDAVTIEQNPVNSTLYLGGKTGEILIYADKRENKSYNEYRYSNVYWQIGYNWLQLQSVTRASRVIVNLSALGETTLNATINFNMNEFLDKNVVFSLKQRQSLYNLPDIAENNEGEIFVGRGQSNYTIGKIKDDNLLLFNTIYSFNSVKITLSGNISKGLQIFNISLVN